MTREVELPQSMALGPGMRAYAVKEENGQRLIKPGVVFVQVPQK